MANLNREIDQSDDDRDAANEVTEISECFENVVLLGLPPIQRRLMPERYSGDLNGAIPRSVQCMDSLRGPFSSREVLDSNPVRLCPLQRF